MSKHHCQDARLGNVDNLRLVIIEVIYLSLLQEAQPHP